MKISLILTTVFCLTGCLSTLDEIGGVGIINKSVSTFDNEQIVELSSSFALDGDGETASTKIGAKWSSGNPESIFLKLIHTSSVNRSDVYVTYEKIEVNLDGEINEFGAGNTVNNSSGYNTVSKTIYTESAASIFVEKEYFEQMLASNDCKIRVHTRDWYEDIVFNLEMQGSRELTRTKLKNFLNEVNSIQ